jgi:hypothetical protein
MVKKCEELLKEVKTMLVFESVNTLSVSMRGLTEDEGFDILSHTKRIRGFPIGYEEVRSISNPPADVCLGGEFEIDVSAAAIMKRFEQISDEDLNKK